jgi:hypothetical protein
MTVKTEGKQEKTHESKRLHRPDRHPFHRLERSLDGSIRLVGSASEDRKRRSVVRLCTVGGRGECLAKNVSL